jgi:hypothetical protein
MAGERRRPADDDGLTTADWRRSVDDRRLMTTGRSADRPMTNDNGSTH